MGANVCFSKARFSWRRENTSITYILGLNAYHGDASACLVHDGRIVAAAEEERFRRIKHWAGFPSEAVGHSLAATDVRLAGNGQMPYFLTEEVKGMSRLTITAKGQITLRKDLLRHLGVEPGQKVEVDALPDGRIEIRAVQPAGTIEDFIGLLEGRGREAASIEEMNRAAAKGWAGQE